MGTSWGLYETAYGAKILDTLIVQVFTIRICTLAPLYSEHDLIVHNLLYAMAPISSCDLEESTKSSVDAFSI